MATPDIRNHPGILSMAYKKAMANADWNKVYDFVNAFAYLYMEGRETQVENNVAYDTIFDAYAYVHGLKES